MNQLLKNIPLSREQAIWIQKQRENPMCYTSLDAACCGLWIKELNVMIAKEPHQPLYELDVRVHEATPNCVELFIGWIETTNLKYKGSEWQKEEDGTYSSLRFKIQ